MAGVLRTTEDWPAWSAWLLSGAGGGGSIDDGKGSIDGSRGGGSLDGCRAGTLAAGVGVAGLGGAGAGLGGAGAGLGGAGVGAGRGAGVAAGLAGRGLAKPVGTLNGSGKRSSFPGNLFFADSRALLDFLSWKNLGLPPPFCIPRPPVGPWLICCSINLN